MPRHSLLLACLIAAMAAGPSRGQGLPIGRKPPESTTKVRKVMVYNTADGWVHVDGIPALEEAVGVLAGKKGFAYQIVKDPRLLTSAFLAGFDVLIWNNNSNAHSSVYDSSTKQAVLDYIQSGGGWVGIHGSMDGTSGWPALAELLGVSISGWGGLVPVDLAVDREARSHPELAHMVADFPPVLRLEAELKGYDRTLRGTEGIMVGATVQPAHSSRKLVPNADGISEQAIWWARIHGKGRMFMTDLSHFRSHYALADSFLVRALWEHLRFAAGDYRNGCTDPASTYFDPAARVEDGSCRDSIPSLAEGRMETVPGATLRLDGLHPSRFTLPFAPSEALGAELLDVQGRKVWSRRLPDSGRMRGVIRQDPGVYLLRFRDGNRHAIFRVLVVGRD